MNLLLKAWMTRLIGFGLAAASPFVARYFGSEDTKLIVDAAGAIGSAVGAVVLTKAAPYVIPTAEKVAKYIPKGLQR